MNYYTHLIIFTDGASRNNPGPAAAAVYVVDATTSAAVIDLGFALGIMTNNEAEWTALLQALRWLLKHQQFFAPNIQIAFHLDALLVVEQLGGRYRITAPNLQSIATAVQACLRQLPGQYTIDHIPRKDNAYADRLANAILDGRRQPDPML